MKVEKIYIRRIRKNCKSKKRKGKYGRLTLPKEEIGKVCAICIFNEKHKDFIISQQKRGYDLSREIMSNPRKVLDKIQVRNNND